MDDKILVLDRDVDLLKIIRPLYLYGITYFDLGQAAIYGYIPIKCTTTGVLFYPR